ncbi:SDR family oxidoreductase [Novosphingobium sp. SG707]|uniref:SDR family oxidoreductase n=1 Tax=Novosphingobium sp. SG707 TaxID=2586996 RepID=UPI0014461737|nr:SDR family oxidoreductase [Novosphingobium sp. SG707]NKJ02761.1 NAD(P)-dependent dehydrogenase (short-subunit alcohol dehydrogenase family) [Novosphingobium sp. SG707]
MGRLTGKRAIVLGAGNKGNMGQHIARRFLDEGAQVTVAGRKESVLAEFAGANACHWAACDITSAQSLAAMADAAVAAMGGVDIAVNATGWGLLKPFLDTTREELDAMTDLQYIGPYQFFQAMIRKMARSMGGQGGSIIQISSATATIMLNDHAAYMGTKAGTDHVIRCVAHEFGAEGIRANSISPGLTETPMTADAKTVPGLFDCFVAGYPLGRIGTSDDIAAAAVFLASDECFMTGENLQVNGGLTLRRNPTREEMGAAIAAATGG